MKDNTEFNESMLERNSFKKAFDNSIKCILAVVAAFAVMCLLVNGKNGICRYSLNLFEFNKTMPVIMNSSLSAETGGIEFTVDSCSVDSENNMLNIYITGKNNTDEVWYADGRTFAVAVQKVGGAFSREYYYNAAGDWKSASAASGKTFFVSLSYQIDDVKKALDDGEVFSLVAFRGADCSTSVIVLNDIINE